MKPSINWLLIPALASVYACSPAGSETKKAEAKPATPARLESTQVREMQPSKEVTLPGELLPWNRVNLYAKVKGFVRQVGVDRGTWVRKGQVLVQLEAPEVLAEVNQAQAQVQAQQANLIQQQSKYRASKLTYRRLLETNRMEGAVSLQEIDQAQSRMEADSALVLSAQESVQASKANLRSKQDLKQYLTLTAPFDGVIIERNISPGALVGAGEAGKPLLVLEDSRTLRLTVAIPEAYANQLGKKSTVDFTVNAIPERVFKGSLARSAESLQAAQRSMMAEFDIPNTKGELKAGMYAQVRLPVERSQPTLFVLRTAVVTSSEKVFVIRMNGDKAQWVTVDTGNTLDSLVEVFGNVKAGDVLVRKASEEIRDGQTVRVE
ncbi:efflux transporter periplasmic adaptor subunit [Siphonobacter sp. BAB-5385]|uniref:efflux RND transporter periplasmic adaptor subunit n=1 Tax=Siphonobacter sp. BAB-5385 TaxID=1864822 RepID=UPI000B9DE082|nr:efflux RND transporter periplasmic adaptor subunit [Siphonobacter sp. BAB-5385]OZI05994.1 efflux transporter periplasmic adaptor subunit [Siphonobacter sp. BAB-5385]